MALDEPVVMEWKDCRVRLTSEIVGIGPSLTLTEVSVGFEEGDPGGEHGTVTDLAATSIGFHNNLSEPVDEPECLPRYPSNRLKAKPMDVLANQPIDAARLSQS